MATRQFDFVTSIETSTVPTASTPTNDNDTVSKGFADSEYARRGSWYDSQSSVTNVKAIAVADRVDRQIVFVDNADTGVFYKFDADSTATGDDDLVLQPDTGSGRWLKQELGGVGGAGAGSSITSLKRGEATTAGDLVYQHQKNFITISSTNQYIDFNEGGGEISATIANAQYLMDTDENRETFVTAIKTAMEAVGGFTYTVTITSENKIKIAGSGSFTLLFGTGTNIANDAAETLGYAASDTGSATSHTASSSINDSFSNEIFWMLTDADFKQKSDFVFGFDTAGGSKLGTATVSTNTDSANYTGLTIGDIYTASGAIVITSGSNDDIDFDEGGGELTATIDAGTYSHPYTDLTDNIKEKMDAAGGETYTVTYSNDDDKITIAATGAFSLDWSTGTNTATTAGAALGFDTSSDTSSATSHEADNRLDLRGKFVPDTSSKFVDNSRFIGFAYKATEAYIFRDTNQDYENVLTSANTWLSEPAKFDVTGRANLVAQDENSQGHGIRVYIDTVAGAPVYKMQYKTSESGAWQDSTTTINYRNGGTFSIGDNWSTPNNGELIGYVKVDPDDDAMVMVIQRNNAAGNHEAYVYSSDGGDTWTERANTESLGGTNWFCGSIDIRNDELCAVTIEQSGTNPRIITGTKSSGEYSTITITDTGVSTINPANPVHSHLQYFPGETGNNQYRYVIAGRGTGGNNNMRFVYANKSLSGWTTLASADFPSGTNPKQPFHAARDIAGNNNRIVYYCVEVASGTESYVAATNDDYNSGTLTIDTGSGTDVWTTDEHDTRYAWNSDNGLNFKFNQDKRAHVDGNSVYFLAMATNDQGTPTSHKLILHYANDYNDHSMTDLVLDTQTTDVITHYSMKYMAASETLVVVYKLSDSLATINSTGQIYGLSIDISGSTPVATSPEQIDGGETLSGMQNWPMVSANFTTANASWEYDDSSNDDLWSNKFV